MGFENFRQEENIIAKDFENILSLGNDPTARNYLKVAERVVGTLTEKNWHNPLLVKDLITQVGRVVEECQKIQKEQDPLIAGYDIMAKIGSLETDLGAFAEKVKKGGFKTVDELKDQFQEQKTAAEKIAELIMQKDRVAA